MTVRVLTIAPVLGCLTFAVAASPSRAALVISTAPTQNVTCTAGDCRPTATDATLDVADLQSYLAAGDVSIKTAGAGGQETGSIQIDAPFSWRTRSRLVLQAGTSITVTRKISVDGQGSLTVDFNGAGIKGAGAGRLASEITAVSVSANLRLSPTSSSMVSTTSWLQRSRRWPPSPPLSHRATASLSWTTSTPR